jgi:hypothetical protein
MVTIYRNGYALGDNLFAALLTQIAVDNGIDARFWHHDPEMQQLMACPLADSFAEPTHLCGYFPESEWDGRSILRKVLDNFQRDRGLRQPLWLTRVTPPVRYTEMPEIGSVRVALCTASGSWSPYRNWPYFAELKIRLSQSGISWQDITDTRGSETLNWAKKAELYVGLETGISHYVSSVVSRGLVLQSGYSTASYWNWYGYRTLEMPVACSPCFLREGCTHEHDCMRTLSIDLVFNTIQEMLNVRNY